MVAWPELCGYACRAMAWMCGKGGKVSTWTPSDQEKGMDEATSLGAVVM